MIGSRYTQSQVSNHGEQIIFHETIQKISKSQRDNFDKQRRDAKQT
jgi:hypothetical protein